MMSLWLAIGLLSLLAVGFVGWPFLKHKTQRQGMTNIDVNARVQENVRIFHEHLRELEVQLTDGRIDEAQFAQLKLELERGLLEDEANVKRTQGVGNLHVGAKTFALIGLLVVAMSAVLYHQLGSSADVEIRQAQTEKLLLDAEDAAAQRAPNPERARALISLIEARLKDEPEQLQYWFFLARTYMELNEFGQAAQAYQEVLRRDQQSGMVMAELAQAMFLRDGNKMSSTIKGMAESALKLEPKNTMALGLAGIGAFSEEDYPKAIKYWQSAATITGSATPEAQALIAGVERAKTLYIVSGGTEAELNKALYGREITLTVSLGDGVAATPEQQVYIYARAWQGAKIPLAITRATVGELPYLTVLNESMAMSPSMSLAQATQVEVVARISQDGTAIAKKDDWQGSFGPVDLDNIPAEIKLVIDHQLSE